MCVHPCFAALHGLPPEVLKNIIKYFEVESKKNVRLVCRFLHDQIIFSQWKLLIITTDKLKLFSDQVDVLKGIEIGCLDLYDESSSEELDLSIEHLVSSHPELQSVRIGSSNCTDRALRALFSTTNIIAIQLSNSNVSGENLESETGITEALQMLNLEPETGLCLQKLNLEVLDLEGCTNLSSKGLENILARSSTTNLAELNLSNTTLSSQTLSLDNTNFPNLVILNLSGCENLKDMFMAEFLNTTWDSLKKINLSDTNITLTETGLLLASFPRLEVLELATCYDITDGGLISFLNRTGGNLRRLNLSETFVTLSGVGLLAASLSCLEELELSSCYDITEFGFISLLNKIGGSLKSLILFECSNITLANVGLLTASFPNLEVLELSSCYHMTELGFISFLNKIGMNLKRLNISLSLNISFSEVGSLTSRFHGLEDLTLMCCSSITELGLIAFLDKALETESEGQGLTINSLGKSLTLNVIKAKFPRIIWLDNEDDG